MDRIRLSDGYVDLERGIVHRGNPSTRLSPTEHRLLQYLAGRPGQVVDRAEILSRVWEYSAAVRTRTIDNTVRRIREKIEVEPSKPVHLLSKYGLGLQLDAATTTDAPPAIPVSSLLGRDAELRALEGALAGGRLVLLRGPGGAGKSRLAAELARRGGWPVVDLAGTVHRDDVIGRVAAALSVAPAHVATALARTPTLVLDCCDRAGDALRERVNDWLVAVPTLRILAASRSPLGAGELVVPLGPLPLPEAVELFCDRARQHTPGFRLTPEDRAPLERLLDAIDRLPLAVELAAARASMGVHHLGAMLDRRLELVGGDDDRGMRATLGWSVASLTPALRDALASLAVFEGSFTLHDAEQALKGAVLERVQALCDRSLVHEVVSGAGRLRYALYELVRDAMRERSPLPADLLRRHAVWFARLGAPEHLERRHQDPEVRASLADGAPELRIVVDRMWAEAPDIAGRAAVALLVHQRRSGQFDAGAALVHRLGDLGCGIEVRGEILCAACALDLARRGGEAVALASRGLLLPLLPHHALHLRILRAEASARSGRLDDARRDLEGCTAEAVLPSTRPLSRGLFHNIRADLHLMQGRMVEALRELDASLAAFHEAGAFEFQANMLARAASVQSELGAWDAAEAAFREALRLGSTSGWNQREEAHVHREWAMLDCTRGRLAESLWHVHEAERLYLAFGDRLSVETVLPVHILSLTLSDRTEEALSIFDAWLRSTRPHRNDVPGRVHAAVAVTRCRLGAWAEAGTAVAAAIEAATAAGEYSEEYGALQGLIDGYLGEPERGRGRISRTLAVSESLGWVVEHARALALSAVFEARFGEPGEARECLVRAGQVVDGLQLGPDAEISWWMRCAVEG
ncbi:MAG: winged helix-turn-helix domain-containing protein [Myxococcota bacterium]